jgi:hypothetical protein
MINLDSEQLARLMEQLASEAAEVAGVSHELQDTLIESFSQAGIGETLSAIIVQRFTEHVQLLHATQRPSAEVVTTKRILASFLEASVLLTMIMEYDLKNGDAREARQHNEERVQAFVGVISNHRMKHHFIDAASQHMGWSGRNYLWMKLIDAVQKR